jgi:hypothetical protein
MNSKLNVAYSYSWMLPSGDTALVSSIIESLRQFAIELGSEAVGPVVVLTGDDAQTIRSDAECVIMFSAIIPNARGEGGPQRYGLGFSPEKKGWSWNGVVRVSSFRDISALMFRGSEVGLDVRNCYCGIEVLYRKNAGGEIEVEQRPAFDLDEF